MKSKNRWWLFVLSIAIAMLMMIGCDSSSSSNVTSPRDTSLFPWTDEANRPANYKALVNPAWVDALIKDENPPTYPGNGYVVLYTSYEPRYSENRTDYVGSRYETGHIPGAIFMDTYSIENGPNSEYGDGYVFPEEGSVKPIAELQRFFGSLGISSDKTVVVYADDDISMMTAGRTAWALLLAGVDDVRILQGNYAAWVAYGGEIETTPNTLPAVDFGAVKGNPQYLATSEDLHDVIDGVNTNAIIVDDREWAEYIGSSNSYYHYFHELGRIPDARWIGDWVELVSEDTQSLRNYEEVENDWITSGFSSDKTMYFYCGTGWRSGLYTFYAYLMGWPAANYDGGWFEWSYYGNPRENGTSDRLVSAEWVDTLINGGNPGTAGTPEGYGGNGYIIIDLDNWAGGYDAGHVTGAIAMSWWELNKEETKNPTTPDGGNLKAPAEMKAKLEALGIDHDTTVVICSKWATLYGRVAWALMCVGVEDVRVLNGGVTAWEANGGTVETTINSRTPITYTGTIPDPVLATNNATTSDMETYMNDPNGAILLDTRTWEEYTGTDDYHAYISTPGRIPGSFYYPYLNMIESGVDGEDSMLRDFDEVRAELKALGVAHDKAIAFVCTIGQRSGFAAWYAYMMGYTNAKNYDSGWYDWIADPTRPIETGDPH